MEVTVREAAPCHRSELHERDGPAWKKTRITGEESSSESMRADRKGKTQD